MKPFEKSNDVCKDTISRKIKMKSIAILKKKHAQTNATSVNENTEIELTLYTSCRFMLDLDW